MEIKSEQNIERLQWIQTLPELEIKIDRRHRKEAMAILTEQDFRDVISKQCGISRQHHQLWCSARIGKHCDCGADNIYHEAQCGFPLQLKDRSVLGLPKTDEQRERDKDLEYESRVDYESWQRDECDGREEG